MKIASTNCCLSAVPKSGIDLAGQASIDLAVSQRSMSPARRRSTMNPDAIREVVERSDVESVKQEGESSSDEDIPTPRQTMPELDSEEVRSTHLTRTYFRSAKTMVFSQEGHRSRSIIAFPSQLASDAWIAAASQNSLVTARKPASSLASFFMRHTNIQPSNPATSPVRGVVRPIRKYSRPYSITSEPESVSLSASEQDHDSARRLGRILTGSSADFAAYFSKLRHCIRWFNDTDLDEQVEPGESTCKAYSVHGDARYSLGLKPSFVAAVRDAVMNPATENRQHCVFCEIALDSHLEGAGCPGYTWKNGLTSAEILEAVASTLYQALRECWWTEFVQSDYFVAYLRLKATTRRAGRVRDYQMIRHIAKGGFGTVFGRSSLQSAERGTTGTHCSP